MILGELLVFLSFIFLLEIFFVFLRLESVIFFRFCIFIYDIVYCRMWFLKMKIEEMEIDDIYNEFGVFDLVFVGFLWEAYI